MRLDNILFRAGFAKTILAARQLISHGHVLVNNSKVNIPSYNCQSQDHIRINLKLGSNSWEQKLLDNQKSKRLIPSHLNVNVQKLEMTILNDFQYQEVGLDLNELLIVEYYSRS